MVTSCWRSVVYALLLVVLSGIGSCWFLRNEWTHGASTRVWTERSKTGVIVLRADQRRDRAGSWLIDGRLEGFYDSGQIRVEAVFRDGKRFGRQRQYHPNGRVAVEMNYVNDVEDGPYSGWDDRGQLVVAGTMKVGKRHGLRRTWYANGQLESEGTYQLGEKTGIWRKWSDEGVVMENVDFDKDCAARGAQVDPAGVQNVDRTSARPSDDE